MVTPLYIFLVGGFYEQYRVALRCALGSDLCRHPRVGLLKWPQVAPNIPGATAAGAAERLSDSVRHRIGKSVWAVVPSPNEQASDGLDDDLLYSISGTSSNDIWAVGYDCCVPHGSQGYDTALIEHWNGAAWSIVPNPKNEPADTQLRGVAAISSNDVWAVGWTTFPNGTLIEHWNGAKWSVVSSPAESYGELWAITALSSKDVWAVGEGNFTTLAEHWDGKKWSAIPTRSGPKGVSVMQSVSAVNANDIWAVGVYDKPGTNAFAEHWNGKSWALVKIAGSFFSSIFSGVTGVAANNVWAVGYENTKADRVLRTLIEQWDGRKWRVVPSPNKDPKGDQQNNWLDAVVAESPTDIWAVGYWTLYQPLALFERWSGKQWTVQRGPAFLESKTLAAESQILGITKIGTGGLLWGAGYQSIPGQCCSGTLTVRATSGE